VLILIWSFAYTSWSIMGRFGLVSLGHGGFMGVGAYVTALFVESSRDITVDRHSRSAWRRRECWLPWWAIPAFASVLTGHYFVLVTLGAVPASCFRSSPPRATTPAARSAIRRTAHRQSLAGVAVRRQDDVGT